MIASTSIHWSQDRASSLNDIFRAALPVLRLCWLDRYRLDNAINYYARLMDGKKAEESLSMLISELSGTNLLTISPKGIAGAPDNVFAVDGNEAGAAGVAEMLLQSQSGEIVFLPALSPAWPKGSVHGLCARRLSDL